MSAAASAASNATAGDAGAAAAAAAAAMVGLPQPWGFFLIGTLPPNFLPCPPDPPLFSGIFISLVLFGIIVAQTWNYYNSFPEDSKWLKLYVGAVFTVDFLSSFFVLWWIYHLLIENWGNIQPYMMLHWGACYCSASPGDTDVPFSARRGPTARRTDWPHGTSILCLEDICYLWNMVGERAGTFVLNDGFRYVLWRALIFIR